MARRFVVVMIPVQNQFDLVDSVPTDISDPLAFRQKYEARSLGVAEVSSEASGRYVGARSL